SSSKLTRDQTSNPTSSTNPTLKGRIRRSSKQKLENSHFEEHLTRVATMTDNRTMAEMIRAPTEGCAEAIVVPPILAEQFELKHSLINMMNLEHTFDGAARRWLEKEPSRSITTWDDLGELKAITTRSRLVTEGPTVPNPLKSINPEEDECVEETYTDPDHTEYTIKVPPPPPVQKPKPPI
nr:hypothetical protein [Tanacetum cinerariifolium]